MATFKDVIMTENPMIIHLNLRNHCIETEIRQIHNRCMVSYFKNPDDRNELSETIEVLVQVMADWNFPALRSTYPELAGGGDLPVQLIADDPEQVTLRIDGREIQPIFKS